MSFVKNYCWVAIGLVILLLGIFGAIGALQAIVNYTHDQDTKVIAWAAPPISVLLLIFGGMLSLKHGKTLIK